MRHRGRCVCRSSLASPTGFLLNKEGFSWPASCHPGSRCTFLVIILVALGSPPLPLVDNVLHVKQYYSNYSSAYVTTLGAMVRLCQVLVSILHYCAALTIWIVPILRNGHGYVVLCLPSGVAQCCDYNVPTCSIISHDYVVDSWISHYCAILLCQHYALL